MLKSDVQKMTKEAIAKRDGVVNSKITISINIYTEILMLSKCNESIEVERRTWLHMPSETLWSTSSDTRQVVEIYKDTSIKMYTPF